MRAAATRALIRYGAAAIPGLELARQDADPRTRMRSEEILAEIRTAANAAEANATPSPPAATSPDVGSAPPSA